MRQKILFASLPLGLVFLTFAGDQALSQRSIPIRVDRWLIVRQTQGNVVFQALNTAARPAKVGDRLQNIGESITTSQNGAAMLEVDTGVGFVKLADNTLVRVRSLQVAADNGRITHLEVPKGQVRLQLRRFTHSGSDLKIWTPAGVSAVRGTVFGVSIQPNGKTGLATLQGKVDTIAQERTIAVPAGFQNLTIPGEPPSAAVPLRDSTELTYKVERRIENARRVIRLVGKVDPVNTVVIRGVSQTTDRQGGFVLLLPPETQGLQITVITPLGRRQVHYIAIAV